MKVVIIEDEIFAFKELQRMLSNIDDQIDIVAHFDCVKDAVTGIVSVDFDLLFLDISLPDGFSFEILNQVEIHKPIIFTTAYDEYAIKAFKYNSIDYLLKPIDEDDLKNALDKFDKLQTPAQDINYNKISNILELKQAKKRFLIKIGDKYSYVPIDHIAYFYSEDKYTFIKTRDNHTHITDYTLNEIEELMNQEFFRVSRNVITQLTSIQNVSKYFNSRLKIELHPAFDEELLISRKKVKSFLAWLDS